MITPPIRRVETPQDVVHACCSVLSRPWNWISNALAKFCPRSWDVPACSARPSPISASIEYVFDAPANFSLALFCPSSTGMASTFSENSLYTAEHPQRFFVRLGLGLVRRVPLLPEELRRPQERTRDLLPADDVGPLVDEDGQVAPRLDPLGVHRPDDGFGRGPHDQRLIEILAAALGDEGHLRRKALDVLGLPHDQALRDEERKVRVHVARLLEPRVEPLLDQLPHRVAVRAGSPCTL